MTLKANDYVIEMPRAGNSARIARRRGLREACFSTRPRSWNFSLSAAIVICRHRELLCRRAYDIMARRSYRIERAYSSQRANATNRMLRRCTHKPSGAATLAARTRKREWPVLPSVAASADEASVMTQLGRLKLRTNIYGWYNINPFLLKSRALDLAPIEVAARPCNAIAVAAHWLSRMWRGVGIFCRNRRGVLLARLIVALLIAHLPIFLLQMNIRGNRAAEGLKNDVKDNV